MPPSSRSFAALVRERHAISYRAALLLFVLFAPSACGGDVPPEELEASFYIHHPFASAGEMNVIAVVSGEDLPDAEVLDISVNGRALKHDASGGSMHAFGTRGLPVPAPGAPFEILFATDGGSAELSVPMVHPTSVVTERPAIGLEPGDSFDLAWTESFPEERDWIYFRGQGYVSGGLPPTATPESVLEVPSGATSITVPPELVATWREGVELVVPGAIAEPILGTVVVLRTRIAPSSPALAGGQVVVALEVVNQAVTLLP